jgi:hypothetical protein
MRAIVMPPRTASNPNGVSSRSISPAERIKNEGTGRSLPERGGPFGETRTQSQFVESAATSPQAATIMVCSGGGKSGDPKSGAAVACLGRERKVGALVEPNLAFKRTPNSRPRNGIMLIFTIARPAVWRRLTLR